MEGRFSKFLFCLADADADDLQQVARSTLTLFDPYYTRKKSIGVNSGNFLCFPKCVLGTLESTFHDQKTVWSGDH